MSSEKHSSIPADETNSEDEDMELPPLYQNQMADPENQYKFPEYLWLYVLHDRSKMSINYWAMNRWMIFFIF